MIYGKDVLNIKITIIYLVVMEQYIFIYLNLMLGIYN